MKKSDLKTGMLVELRRGDTAWVLKDTADGDWLQWDDARCLNLEEYNNELLYSTYSCSPENYDIIKIYQPNGYQYLDKESINKLKLIYERNENEIKVHINAQLEGIDEIKKIIDELENKLKNIKVNLSL